MTNSYTYIRLFLSLILISLIRPVYAQDMIRFLHGNSIEVSVGDSLYIFEDQSGQLNIKGAMDSHLFSNEFPGTEQSQGHYWMKFHLINTGEFDQEVVFLFDRTSYVQFYQVVDGNVLHTANSGTARKKSQIHPSDDRRFVRLILASGVENQVFVKFENTTDYLPHFWFRLVSPEIHTEEENIRLARDSLLFGAVWVLIIYSISLFTIHRFKPYLWLTIHAFGFMMYSFTARDYLVDWIIPELPALGFATPWALLGHLGLLVLIISFLKMRDQYPKWFKVIRGLAVLTVLQLIWSCWQIAANGAYVLTTKTNLYIFIINVILLLVFLVSIWKGLTKSQKAFGFGLFFFVGVIILGVTSWFLVDTLGRTVVTALSSTASLGQILIFAIALGIEMRQHEVDKNKALSELYNVLKEQNEKIEKEVVDRTVEIQERNERIETLFKEVHHRVKNNLQLISSLLNMQQEWSSTEDPAKAIEDSRSRVVAMSMIHQFLYRTDDISVINFKTYIEELATKLNDIQVSPVDYRLQFDFEEDYDFDIDTSISLGLILNELITNSYKYALGNDDELRLTLKLNKSSDEHFNLVYIDNGQEIKGDFQEVVQKGFGLRLASRLSRQLQGKFAYEYKEGNHFSVTFSSYESRMAMADADS